MRGKIYFLSLIFCVLLFLLVDYSMRSKALIFLANTKSRSEFQKSALKLNAAFNVSDNGLQGRLNLSSNTPQLDALSEDKFNIFVQNYLQLEEGSDQAEKLLESQALSLDANDIAYLKNLIFDTNKQNFARQIGVELMTLSKKNEAQLFLYNFAQDENVNGKNKEFEVSLRAQATEGLIAFPNLKLVTQQLQNIKRRTNLQLINDRAEKALQFLAENINLIETNEPKAQINL